MTIDQEIKELETRLESLKRTKKELAMRAQVTALKGAIEAVVKLAMSGDQGIELRLNVPRGFGKSTAWSEMRNANSNPQLMFANSATFLHAADLRGCRKPFGQSEILAIVFDGQPDARVITAIHQSWRVMGYTLIPNIVILK